MRESQIIHESGPFWVCHEGPGHFTVWQVRGCASYRCGTFAFRNDPAYARSHAIEHCNQKAREVQ